METDVKSNDPEHFVSVHPGADDYESDEDMEKPTPESLDAEVQAQQETSNEPRKEKIIAPIQNLVIEVVNTPLSDEEEND